MFMIIALVVALLVLFALCLYCAANWFYAHVKGLTLLHHFTVMNGNEHPTDTQYKESQDVVIDDMAYDLVNHTFSGKKTMLLMRVVCFGGFRFKSG